MPSSPAPQVIGQSLLPPGIELGAYVKSVADLLLKHIMANAIVYQISEDDLVDLTTQTLCRLGWRAEHLRKTGTVELKERIFGQELVHLIGLDDGDVVSVGGESGWLEIYAKATQKVRKNQEDFYKDDPFHSNVSEDPYARPIEWKDKQKGVMDGIKVELILERAPDLIDRVCAEIGASHLVAATTCVPGKTSRSPRL